MDKYSVVQIYSEQDAKMIQELDCNHLVFLTKPSDETKLEIMIDIGGKYRKVKGVIHYKPTKSGYMRFDEVRNLALSVVNTDYTLMLDADELILTPELINYWCEKNKEAYVVNIISTFQDFSVKMSPTKRLFKTKYRYTGWSHEQPNIDEAYQTDLLIKHVGYINNQNNIKKNKRNVDLCIESGLALTNNYQRYKLYQGLKMEFENGNT